MKISIRNVRKKWFTTLTASALVTASVLTFVPMAFGDDGPVTAANPPLVDECGVDISMILDASGSIDQAGAVGVVRETGNRLVSALADRNVTMSIVEFGTSADIPIPPTIISGATVASTFGPYFAGTSNPGYYDNRATVGNYTNWEDGFRVAGTLPPADLVLFVTDGEPNTVGPAGVAVGDNSPISQAVDAAVLNSNALKARGSRIFGMGIGGVNTPEGLKNMQKVTGGAKFTGDLSSQDYVSGDFSDLLAAVDSFTESLCGGNIAVNSIIDVDGDLNTIADRVPAVDWPVFVTPVDAVKTPATKRTDGGGATNFDGNFAAARSQTIAINQPPLKDYAVWSVDCVGATGNGQFDYRSEIRNLTFDSGDLIRCTFLNIKLPVDLGIEKDVAKIDDNDNSGDTSIGDTIRYTLLVTNDGAGTLHNVVAKDPMLADLTCTPNQPATLNRGEAMRCTGSHVITGEDGTRIVNTATADSDETPEVSDTEIVVLPSAQLAFDKWVLKIDDEDTSGDNSAGDVVHYRLEATNIGVGTLTNAKIVDDMLADLTCASAMPVAKLAPKIKLTCSGSYVITKDDARKGSYIDNRAYAESDQTGKVYDAERVPVPALSLRFQKLIDDIADNDGNGEPSAGDVVRYVLTATNVGAAKLTALKISDPMFSSMTCDPAGATTLSPGSSVRCFASVTLTRQDHGTTLTNVASATTRQTGTLTDEASLVIREPRLALTKMVESYDDVDDSGDYSPGDAVHYLMTATNTGSMTLTGVAIADPMLADMACVPDLPAKLAADEMLQCRGTRSIVAGDLGTTIKNTASATSRQTDPVDASVDVAVGRPSVAITKTVTSITDRNGDGTTDVGDVVNYAIKVANTGTANLSHVTISDPLVGEVGCDAFVVGHRVLAGTDITCTGSYLLRYTDVDTTLKNVATVSSHQVPAASADVSTKIPVGAACPSFAVKFGGRLLNNSDDSQTVTYKLAAGTYVLTLVSADLLHGPGHQPGQTGEQWVVEFLDATGKVIAKSGPSADLDELVRVNGTTVGAVTVPADTVSLRARHAHLGPEIDSVDAMCVIIGK